MTIGVDFKEHSNMGYQNTCVLLSNHFVDVIKYPTEPITCKI